jgi:hypothetical protein
MCQDLSGDHFPLRLRTFGLPQKDFTQCAPISRSPHVSGCVTLGITIDWKGSNFERQDVTHDINSEPIPLL